jgi:hypothetical protein
VCRVTVVGWSLVDELVYQDEVKLVEVEGEADELVEVTIEDDAELELELDTAGGGPSPHSKFVESPGVGVQTWLFRQRTGSRNQPLLMSAK